MNHNSDKEMMKYQAGTLMGRRAFLLDGPGG
jgi:hypothetical protein